MNHLFVSIFIIVGFTTGAVCPPLGVVFLIIGFLGHQAYRRELGRQRKILQARQEDAAEKNFILMHKALR